LGGDIGCTDNCALDYQDCGPSIANCGDDNPDGTEICYEEYEPPKPEGKEYVEIVAADIDGDADPDLAMIGLDGNVYKWRNDSPDDFPWFEWMADQGQPPLGGLTPNKLIAGNFNSAQGIHDEVVVSDVPQTEVRVLQGLGNVSNWGVGPTLGTNATPTHMAVGDIDDDGDLDFVVACSGSTDLQVFRGEVGGGGAFDYQFTAFDIDVGVQTNDVEIADFNGDGKGDYVLAATNGDRLFRMVSDPNGNTFTTTSVESGDEPSQIRLAAFTDDSTLDAISLDSGEPAVTLYAGPATATDSFAEGVSTMLPAEPSDFEVGDFNLDGEPDVVVTFGADDHNRIGFLINDGAGVFTYIDGLDMGTPQHAVVVADFDDNGRADLAIALKGDTKVSMMMDDF
jgi:hypothetical protein